VFLRIGASEVVRLQAMTSTTSSEGPVLPARSLWTSEEAPRFWPTWSFVRASLNLGILLDRPTAIGRYGGT